MPASSGYSATGGPTGYWGIRDDAAMKGLQKEGGLTVDGWAGPGGETMRHFQTIYLPQQGVQMQTSRQAAATAIPGDPGAVGDYAEAIRNTNQELVGTLGLDPAKMDLEDPETMRGLSAVRFYHHLNRQQQYQAMNDIARLGKRNPELAGKLRVKIADSIANPIWEISSMTPERLEQAISETEQGLKIAKVFDFMVGAGGAGWKLGKPRGAPKAIGRGFGAGGLMSGWMVDGYEKLMHDLKTEQARRSSGP